MAYIWSYLRRYPKWLAMNFTAAILFVIANLGLPTVLARMIDEGINRGDVDKLYAYAWVMFGVVLLGLLVVYFCPMRLEVDHYYGASHA